MTNNLISETSPYLLQHKDNPVNWFAWNDKTLSYAKRKNMPILLSIGYSSCHWCHVMAHESFEDKYIASIMNSSFINIKIDREERPDVDALYQAALSVMGQRGGWPLTMFLDSNLVPFWGGTYFPKVSKHGLPSFKDVLYQITHTYKNNLNNVRHNSNLINQTLVNFYNNNSPSDYSKEDIKGLLVSIVGEFDPVGGGLTGSPKFPMFPLLRMLLYMSGTPITKNINLLKTLKKSATSLCLGGIYDHVCGGLSRYSTDEYWLVPHFEKMLYDNAQFIDFLSSLVSLDNSPLYVDRIDKTFSWLDGEMFFSKSNSCAYFSAIDADSDGVEGLYYVWDYNEIIEYLGEGGKEFALQYGAKNEGNWEGKNILNRIDRDSGDDVRYEISEENKTYLSKLLSKRKQRPRPGIDNKILTDWNAMLICGFLRAYVVLKDEKYLNRARGIYSFLLNNHFVDGALYHSSCNGKLGSCGLLDDYANFIKAGFFLYEVSEDTNALNLAKKLMGLVKLNFLNEAASDFYISDNKEKNLFLKTTNRLDTAVQSGSSIMLENLIKGFYYFGDDTNLDLVGGAIKNSWVGVRRNPASSIGYIAAAYMTLCGYQFVALIKNDLFGKKVKNYLLKLGSFSVLTFFYDEKTIPKNTAIGSKRYVDGGSTVYVCSGFVCSPPITSMEAMKEWVSENMELMVHD